MKPRSRWSRSTSTRTSGACICVFARVYPILPPTLSKHSQSRACWGFPTILRPFWLCFTHPSPYTPSRILTLAPLSRVCARAPNYFPPCPHQKPLISRHLVARVLPSYPQEAPPHVITPPPSLYPFTSFLSPRTRSHTYALPPTT